MRNLMRVCGIGIGRWQRCDVWRWTPITSISKSISDRASAAANDDDAAPAPAKRQPQPQSHLNALLNPRNRITTPNLNLNLNFNLINVNGNRVVWGSHSQSHPPSYLRQLLHSDSGSESSNAKAPPLESKQQEMDGPTATVERDLSPLANETREVSLRLMRAMYDVSRLLALLALSHLAAGAWISSSLPPPPPLAVTAACAVAFGVPFSAALMLRQSLKPMRFLARVEEAGRLQILTSTMQMSKQLLLFFARLRTLLYLSLAPLPLSLLFSLLSSSTSAH